MPNRIDRAPPSMGGGRAPWLLGLLLLWLVLPAPAVADETELTPEEEERLEAIELNTTRAWRALRSGNHTEVLARAKRIRRYDPESSLPALLETRVHLRTGAYDEAEKAAAAAAARWPDDAALRAAWLRVLLRLGKPDEALAAAKAVLARAPDDLVALAMAGLAHDERGRRKEALEAFDRVVALYNGLVRKGESGTAPPVAVPLVAKAAERATWLSPNPADDMLRPATRLLGRYLEQHDEDEDVRMQLAELYRSDAGPRGQSLARKRYAEILKQNTEYADARVGQARTDLVFWNQPGALKSLDRALQTNPRHVEALALKAAIHVGNGDYDGAEKAIKRALAVDPNHKEARAVKAALHYIRGETAEFEAVEKALLAWDPGYSALYRTCADLVGERQRRYDVAATFARKALEVDDRDRMAYTTLGEALMNLGQTDEALVQFDKGKVAAKDYADVRRDNWRSVLRDVIPEFEVIETEHFRIRMPRAEARIMRHYLPQLLEEAQATLPAKYGMTVTAPTFVDSFDRNDDFSVRSIGTAGLPALGVCFGRVITLLGPTAMPMGQFSWSRTTWHEFAHVVTVQQSGGQVPRWLTEGLSVFEEQERRPRWGRDMDRELYNRLRNGRLLKMAKINSAFRGPDIMFAYYQGGLIAEHLQEARGFEVIPKMLVRFGDDKSTARVFQEVLGLELAKYDEQFEAFVQKQVGDYQLVPIWDKTSMDAFQERVQKDPKDAEAWTRLAWGHFQRGRDIDAGGALAKAMDAGATTSLEVQLLQGRIAQKAGRNTLAHAHYTSFLGDGGDDYETRIWLAGRALQGDAGGEKAIEHLEAAKVCFPRGVGRDSPYLLLARLHRGAGDMARAIQELEAYAAIKAEDPKVREELRAWYRNQKDWTALARVCEEVNDISPFGANVRQGQPPDLTLHRDWATALEQLGDAEGRLRELAVQVALVGLVPEEAQQAPEQIADRLAYGRAVLKAGDALRALQEATTILRLDPQNADAHMLKARAEEAGSR